MTEREFDLILFGATGFTGNLAARYLAKAAPKQARIALAGRNRERLFAIRDELKKLSKEIHGEDRVIEVIPASLERPETLRAMAERGRVLITTVGPYRLYGEPVLRAAVEAGTDYIDITGEPAFVEEMIRKYHDRAEEKKLRIVPCCGFDSIPHDLGTYFTVKQLPEDEAKEVDAFVRMRGSFSGGTWNSALNAFAEARQMRRDMRRGFADPTTTREVINASKPVRRGPHGVEWALVMPTIDPDIVVRSASMLPVYGPSFRYGHYLHHRSGVSAAKTAVGALGLVGLAQIEPIRKMLGRLRPSGEGPSEEERARSSFEVTFIGRSSSGAEVETRFAGGDPGYDETSKMLSEAALCLAFDREELPPSYGIVTTAAAMGDRLIERCRNAGLVIERVS